MGVEYMNYFVFNGDILQEGLLCSPRKVHFIIVLNFFHTNFFIRVKGGLLHKGRALMYGLFKLLARFYHHTRTFTWLRSCRKAVYCSMSGIFYSWRHYPGGSRGPRKMLLWTRTLNLSSIF